MRSPRSVLYVPAHRPRMLAKLRTIPADLLVVDLEDGVAPAAKDEARPRHRTLGFMANAVIFDEGEPGDRAFIIREGRVDIQKAGNVIATLGPGHIVGEMALFDGKPRMATAIARDEVKAIEITIDEFRKHMKTMDKVMAMIMRLLIKRVRDMGERIN